MNIAVVGASNNAQKYGYRIVKHLIEEGHTIFPVNLKEKTILGLPVFKHLRDIDRKIDIVDVVVPPAATLKIIHEARLLGYKIHLWIQPGAESDRIIRHLNKHSKDFASVTHSMCIMTSLDRVLL